MKDHKIILIRKFLVVIPWQSQTMVSSTRTALSILRHFRRFWRQKYLEWLPRRCLGWRRVRRRGVFVHPACFGVKVVCYQCASLNWYLNIECACRTTSGVVVILHLSHHFRSAREYLFSLVPIDPCGFRCARAGAFDTNLSSVIFHSHSRSDANELAGDISATTHQSHRPRHPHHMPADLHKSPHGRSHQADTRSFCAHSGDIPRKPHYTPQILSSSEAR